MNIVFLDQPVYVRIMGEAIRIRAVIRGSDEYRITETNDQLALHPDLVVLTDTGTTTYLAGKNDWGIDPAHMEVFPV